LDLVRSIPIAFPKDLKEQREIAAALDTIDSKIDLHNEKLTVLNELFTSLLFKVMTGAVQVDDIDASALTNLGVFGSAA